MRNLESHLTALLLIILGLSAVSAQGAQPGSVTHVSDGVAKAYAAYGVSEAVRAGDFLYMGGIVAFADDGSVIAPNDGKKQVEVIYRYMNQLLAAHGATLKNVVSETLYLSSWELFLPGAATRVKAYDDAHAAYPTSVAVEVKALAEKGLVLEVQAVAYLGK